MRGTAFVVCGAVVMLGLSGHVQAQELTYPKDFRTQYITTNGTQLHVRVGGSGPAVVLLHGYGETGDMWAPMAEELGRDQRLIVAWLHST